ncbi:MAG: PAS domain S-box protein [Syntrophales bacterium]
MAESAELKQRLSKSEKNKRQIRRKYQKLSKSEQEKSVILDAMSELVLYLDTDLRVIWANEAMHKAFRLKPGELDGRYCYTGLHNRSKACSICPAQRTLETGEPHEVDDFSSYGKIWVLRSYPVRDEEGFLTGIVEIVTDMTERRKAEEALRQSEQKFRELFENANDMIYFLDFKGNVLSCNASTAKTYGYSPEEMLGLNINQFVDKNHLPTARNILQKKLEGKEDSDPQELLTYTKGGEAVWVEVNTRLVREKGIPVSIQGIARNITERKRMEEALKRRERELEEKSRNLEEANMALKVLLKHREEDRAELEEKVLYNMKELILPYIDKLKMTRIDSHQLNQLNILESNVNEVISPFLRNLSLKYPNLTPREIQIINFIKEGRTTKEIAKLTNSSARTIDFHRDNIRKKLNLKNRKANLRSYLLSF